MRCIVTGGAGFIGSSLVLRLRAGGHDVTVIDNMTTGRQEFLDELRLFGIPCFVDSYGSEWSCKLVASGNFDVVFHVGAVPRVAYSVEQPASTDANNVGETLKLLEACRGNVGRVVFSSSSSVLGDVQDGFPSMEYAQCSGPMSPYALQKWTAEEYCRMFNRLYGLDVVCLRYFNVFGPRQYGDSPYSTVISAWCQALHDDRPLRLDGSGEQSRDFCYIDNVVEANVLAGTCPRKFQGNAINIAHGECHSVLDVLERFQKRFGRIKVKVGPPRQGDVMKTHASLFRAENLLGYEPKVSFDEGLERTWKWWGL